MCQQVCTRCVRPARNESTLRLLCRYVLFFFQAEDGIRDYKVTGVQTCALPISTGASWAATTRRRSRWTRGAERLHQAGVADLLRTAVRAEVLQVSELADRVHHLGRDGLGLERTVLHDPRVDARGPALADRRPGEGVLGLAVPVQRVLADVGERDGRHDPVAVGGGADEAEVDLAHHERRAVVLDHLLDRIADDPEQLVLRVVEPGDDPRVEDVPERVGFPPVDRDLLPVHRHAASLPVGLARHAGAKIPGAPAASAGLDGAPWVGAANTRSRWSTGITRSAKRRMFSSACSCGMPPKPNSVAR